MIEKVALFSLGGNGFALAVEQIDQIISEARVFAVPLLPPGFRGLLLFRGEAVPLLDPQRELGLPAPEDSAISEYAVVLRTEAGKIGLQADQVLRIVGREQGRIEQANDREIASCCLRQFVFGGTYYPFPDMDSFIASLPDRTHPGVPAEGTKED